MEVVEILKKDFIRRALYIPRAIILFTILIPAYLFVAENDAIRIKEKIKSVLKNYKVILFLFWMAFLMMSTIFTRWTKVPYRVVLGGFGIITTKGLNTDSLENILLFIPYTFHYLLAFHPEKPWKAALKLSLLSTFTIELLQLIFWLGAFQFSDILHNTEGGIIGCGLWHLVRWIKSRCLKK